MPVFVLAGVLVFSVPAWAKDVIWDNSEVRVINNYFEVNGSDKLIIEPGTIIKMAAGSSIISYGDITAIGNAANPIVFTSLKDDSVGGDTNNDNDATAPALGDWGYFLIQGDGAHITMDYAEIHYGGGNNKRTTSFISVSNSGEKFTKLKEINITHSSITNNFGTISFYGEAIFKISESNFYNDVDCPLPKDWDPIWLRCDKLSISKGGTIAIEAPYVYWGHAEGPTTLDDYYKGIKKGTRAFANVNYQPFLIEPWPSNLTEKKLDPVIIVPGIMGSWNVGGEWQLDPILNTYDNLWEALKLAGYVENETLFAFPYQWRLSNVYTAELLKEKINEVKVICDCGKVDIVAHSMGGLAARSYIEGSDYQNDVDQLIFLATPHQGATTAYLTWEGGDLGQTSRDSVFERIITLEALKNGYIDLYNYVRNFSIQSVQELLPIYDYLRDDDTMQLRAYPDNYPVNTFLELLNNPSQLNNLNSVRVVNILADAGIDSTINSLRVIDNWVPFDPRWEHGKPENYDMPFTDHGLEYGAGDTTVPERSNKDFMGAENIVIASDHDGIVTDAQKRVIKELTGVEPAEEVRMNIFKKYLLVRIFSPADFVITAPDGKKLGKDFLSKQALNEIPNAFYSGFEGEIEFAVIPDPFPGDYGIGLEGTGNGEYTLSASIISDEEDVDKNYTAAITPGETKDFNFTYSGESAGDPLSGLKPEAAKTIAQAIAHIEEIYAQGWITKEKSKNILIKRLNHLENKLDDLEKQKEKIAEQIKKTEGNEKLKPKAKQKVLEELNQKLDKISENRQKTINHDLDLLEKRLNIIKKKDRINQEGYDIIIRDVNSLKINL